MLRTRSPGREADIPIAPSLYSLSNKMDNSLLVVRDINHIYIVIERKDVDSMSIFKRKFNTTTLLERECRRLERERNEAYAKLEALSAYQNDYEELIANVRRLKKRYEELILQNQTITEHYKNELEKVIKPSKSPRRKNS